MNTAITTKIKDYYKFALSEIRLRESGQCSIPKNICQSFIEYIDKEFSSDKLDEKQAELTYEKAYVLGLYADFGHTINDELVEKIKSFKTVGDLYRFKNDNIRCAWL